ncbi:amidohydrolase family protein [Vibrio breoganii]|uniref:amidohydrolase family protein n=1 Tax=Vibrio breoganii TaxID=553239 RepID=UPI000C834E75|nr:amidohydrolase family protein [Vibrio breoganii]PMG94751.1 hypothetical protein BCU80_06140 [Vibrio breoganii]
MLNNIKFFDSLTHIKEDMSWYKTTKKADLSLLQHYYQQGELTKAVIAAMPDDDYDYIGNTVLEQLPFCSTVFSIKSEWLGKSDIELKLVLSELKQKYGAVGIKVHPRFSHIDIDSEQLQRVANLATSIGLIVYVCTILRKPVGPVTHTVHYHLAHLCEKCPETKFVFLHGGYTDLFSMGEIIRDYPNAYLDLSFTFMRFRKSSLALDVGYLFETLDKKVIIGTDFPEYTPAELKSAVEKYILSRNDLVITKNKLENIFYKNLDELVNYYE